MLELLREALAERYAVERELGRGGMATVYLARDLKHQRAVAIKVLDPELGHAIGAERFLREIEIAARLQHPHILPLYDSGSAGGLLYYVMPYVEGETLLDRLHREKQLSVEETIRIACEVASALGYAHSRGVIHRDIKPANIMLSGGHAVVADFGIARAVSAAEGESLTQAGTVIGTPAYMSPEQNMGGVVDARSDVYSLACVVYEMLLGEPPFTGLTAQAVMARHSMDAVSPPSIVRGTIPDAVEDAVLRALEKVPADRFLTAAQFAEALSTPSMASGPTRRITRAGAARTGHAALSRGVLAGLVTGGVLVGLVIIGVGISGTWAPGGWWRAARGTSRAAVAGAMDPHRIAILYLEDLSPRHELSYLADGLTEALIDQLAPVQQLQVISKYGVASYRQTTISRDSVAKALQVGSLIAGSVENAGDRLRVTIRLIDGASGADIERKSFEQAKGDLLRIREQLGQQVAGFLRRRLGEEIRMREQKAGTGSVAAWALVQQAEKARKDADSLASLGDPASATRMLIVADSMLGLAEATDPTWTEPILLRGTIAYRRSRMKGQDGLYAAPFIKEGLGHAARALAKNPNDARTLELRGTLHYWSWLLHLTPGGADAAALLKDAEQDLRAAVRIDPSLAGAWGTLSHLDYQKSDVVQAKLDAQRAYEADAYYGAADVILWRLYTASYDLEQFVDARHWCAEGQLRVPGSARFLQCQLWLLTTKVEDPDVPKAWRLVQELSKVTPPRDWGFEKLRAQIAVAGVLARAGLADSARHLLVQSRGNPELDPTHALPYYEAFVRTLLGDRDEALRQLTQYLAAQPERRSELANDYQWWFRDLRSDPRYRELAGTGK